MLHMISGQSVRRSGSTLVLALLLASSTGASAQSSVTLRGGASLPYGDFDRSAQPGYGGGIELQLPLQAVTGLAVTISADLLLNRFDIDIDTAALGVPVTIDDQASHRTIPVLAGVRWTYAPTLDFAAFLAGQGGTALYRHPSMTVTIGDGDEFEADFDMTSKLVLALGGGVVVAQRVEIGARVYPLGRFPIGQAGMTFSGPDVSMVTVMLGVRL